MKLENFKVLSKDAYEALSERDQVKYEMQLEQWKEQEQERIANEAATKAIDAMKVELKTEREAELLGLTEAHTASLKELAEKHQLNIEDMQAQLKRAKISEVGIRMKTMQEDILEKFSTEKGEELLKGFLKGRKDLDIDLDDTSKAIITPAGGVAPQFVALVGPGHDENHARSVIPVFPTISDVIKFLRYTVDETSGEIGMVAEGATKPTINYIGTPEEANVRKIAALIDINEEAWDDVVGLRAWLAYELPKVYMDYEDLQIFKGDGTGINLLGLWEQADFQTLPLGSVNSGSNTIDKIAAGITEVRILKRATSAVFVSPIQYMEIFINKGNTDEYTYPVIFDNNNTLRIGGVPVYWSSVFEGEEGLVGDFARGTAIFQRKAMNIAYSAEHKDNFAKNVITMRVEGRIALPIYYPESFLRLFVPGT